MGAKEIREFLTHLSVDKRVSASTQNQAFSGLLFLYREFMKIEPDAIEGVVRSKRPTRIPTVLSREEVHRIFSGMEGIPQLIANPLLYRIELGRQVKVRALRSVFATLP